MLGTHATSSTQPQAHRLTVLLAPSATSAGTQDTHPWNETLAHLLAPQGINLLLAHTGREALSMLESNTVHVAVLDSRLPQLSGLQVIKLARDHGKAASTASILLADSLSNALLHEALSMSVFTVLAKPVNHNQLLDAMARAMRRFHNSQWPT